MVLIAAAAPLLAVRILLHAHAAEWAESTTDVQGTPYLSVNQTLKVALTDTGYAFSLLGLISFAVGVNGWQRAGKRVR